GYQISEYYKTPRGYLVMTNKEKADKLRALDFIKGVIALNDDNTQGRFDDGVFPTQLNNEWTFNNFGPLYIPQKGVTIQLNDEHAAIYGALIANHEGLENVRVDNNQVFIDDVPIKEYTFQQDYFFMMGDNRHNSHDSRAWGFVPMNHVVGKALFTWFSLEEGPMLNFFGRVRWDRIIKKIN
ncbi:MAG: signal peptidase I, partial [Bacteroidota bacterium]